MLAESKFTKFIFGFMIIEYIISIPLLRAFDHEDIAINSATMMAPLFALIGYFIVECRAEKRLLMERELYFRQSLDNAIGAITVHYNFRNFKGEEVPHYYMGEIALEKYCLWIKSGLPRGVNSLEIRPEKCFPIVFSIWKLDNLYKDNKKVLREENELFFQRYSQIINWVFSIFEYYKKNNSKYYEEFKLNENQKLLDVVMEKTKVIRANI